MTKRDVIVAGCSVAVALVLGGAGLWWHGHTGRKAKSVDSQTVGNHMIALGQNDSSDSGGLSVSGQADNLGQLGGNGSGQSKTSGSGSGSGSSGGVDPSTFSQYDKYQSNNSALFGDIQTGNGTQLGAGQKASIYYKAWLTNGALVDQSPVSSSGQPQPYSFTLGAHQVIPGLEEGIFGMKAGGKRLVIVPPAVGYGSQGQGAVPPNAIMIFEVQLVSVQ